LGGGAKHTQHTATNNAGHHKLPAGESTARISIVNLTNPAAHDSSTTTQTTTQTTQTSTDSSTSIEGCLNGSAGSFTLTDQSGKTWQLAGDTAKLGDHVGHQLRISGTDNSGSASSPSSGAGSSASSSGAMGSSSGQSTFTVKKVRMISSSCSTSK